jgi:hypothetical protein
MHQFLEHHCNVCFHLLWTTDGCDMATQINPMDAATRHELSLGLQTTQR